MKKLLREPLVHFLLLGGVIFLLYGWLNSERVSEDEIVVTAGKQEHLVNVFARTWQRPPTRQEFEGLLNDYIREEIAYREGKAMGFDEGDTIIRRRMRQKLELLTDEIVGFDEPTDSELQTYLEENPGQFRLEPVLDLRHIYFSSDRRGSSNQADAQAALEVLQTNPDIVWTELGDPFPIGRSYSQVRLTEIERQMGEEFVEGLPAHQTDGWTGPVPSAYGLHLIMIDQFTPGRDPELEEVRDRVRNEWFVERRQQATDDLYDSMGEKYTIRVEPMDRESQL